MKAIILTNDKQVLNVDIKGSRSEFTFRKGLYVLSPTAINRRIDPKRNKILGAEAIYFESTSTPVPTIKPGELDGDPSSAYLGQYVITNALTQTGAPAMMGALGGVIKQVKELVTLRNIAMFIIFGSIAYNMFMQNVIGAV